LELYSLAKQTSKPIHQYDSLNASITHLVKADTDFFLVCIRLEANGKLGEHQAVQNQLFIVVEGEGRVNSNGGEFAQITAGQAAFWRAGERHETRSETGLTAIVIEGRGIFPNRDALSVLLEG